MSCSQSCLTFFNLCYVVAQRGMETVGGGGRVRGREKESEGEREREGETGTEREGEKTITEFLLVMKAVRCFQIWFWLHAAHSLFSPVASFRVYSQNRQELFPVHPLQRKKSFAPPPPKLWHFHFALLCLYSHGPWTMHQQQQ